MNRCIIIYIVVEWLIVFYHNYTKSLFRGLRLDEYCLWYCFKKFMTKLPPLLFNTFQRELFPCWCQFTDWRSISFAYPLADPVSFSPVWSFLPCFTLTSHIIQFFFCKFNLFVHWFEGDERHKFKNPKKNSKKNLTFYLKTTKIVYITNYF